MRVGLITQLLWPRYGPFWRRLLEGVGAETAVAEPRAVLAALDDPRLRAVPAAAFRLAAAEAVALQDAADLLLVPDLNPGGDVPRGGGQDPWVAAFPDTLAGVVSGLPPTLAVPASLEGPLDTLAIETLHRVLPDPARVRRAWERNRSSARAPRTRAPRWTRLPDQVRTVGVVGPPWLMRDALVAALAEEGVHLVAQHRLDPRELRDEGLRYDARLVPTDAETLGAARLFARSGAVDALTMIADRASGADAWLARRVAELSHKPVRLLHLQDLLPPEALLDALTEPS